MKRRSLLKGGAAALLGLFTGGLTAKEAIEHAKPQPTNRKPKAVRHIPCEAGGQYKVNAGERLYPGDLVSLGADGKVYRGQAEGGSPIIGIAVDKDTVAIRGQIEWQT